MRMRFLSPFIILTLLLALVAQAQDKAADSESSTTPVGRWQTVDDRTGKIDSVVVLWEENGKLYGRIERLVNPNPNDPVPRCVRCSGDLKDRSLVGLRIIWDLTKNGDQWSGGVIVDPNSGKAYRCSIAVTDGGKKLRVRGFIGFSLLGRTEYWLRDE